MNFYIDFEATQPEQEIISVGVVAENGETFHSLVKPQFSSVSKYISDMTGITQDKVETAKPLDDVFATLYHWIREQENSLTNWHFFSYGDGDVDFIKYSIGNIHNETPLVLASLMIATMKDYSKTVTKYFHGTTSLIKAFNYIEALERKQKHNALEDARMLSIIASKIDGKEPLPTNPFKELRTEAEANYKFPSGKFYCRGKGKNAKEREFECIEQAMEWLINLKIGEKNRPMVRRDRIAQKIMKAIRKNETYMEYNWRRIKNKEVK